MKFAAFRLYRGRTMRVAFSLVAALVGALQLRADEPIVVALRPEARPAASLVRLGEIADISGGTLRERQRVEQLDIADAPVQGGDDVVTRSQVEFRLLLGGLPETVRVTGAEQTRLTGERAEAIDELLLSAVRRRLAQRLHVEERDIAVQLTEPLPKHLTLRPATDDVEFRPVLPAIPRPGPLRLKTTVYVDGSLKHLISVGVDFALRGQPAEREQPTTTPVKEKPKEEPIVVRPRDSVRLIVRGTGLRVSIPAAEALQSGRVGDTIRVKNPRSGRVVAGRITSAGEVEIEL